MSDGYWVPDGTPITMGADRSGRGVDPSVRSALRAIDPGLDVSFDNRVGQYVVTHTDGNTGYKYPVLHAPTVDHRHVADVAAGDTRKGGGKQEFVRRVEAATEAAEVAREKAIDDRCENIARDVVDVVRHLPEEKK
jgi:hypothetical protein